MSRKPLSRRTFLQGFGVTISLPLLEAMLPSVANAAVTDPRFVALYFPMGIVGNSYAGRHMGAWQPNGTGPLSGLTLPAILEPLNNFKNDFSVLSGLSLPRNPTAGDGEHAAAAALFLTCAQPPDFRNSDKHHDSADMLLGQHLKTKYNLPFQSIVASPNGKSGMDGFGGTSWVPGFTGNVSYFGGRRAEKIANPLLLFDRLFPNTMPTNPTTPTMPAPDTSAKERLLRQRRSILDFSKSGVDRLKKELGVADQQRLDEYLEGIRDVERQLASIMIEPPAPGSSPAPMTGINPQRPPAEVHNNGDDLSHTNSNYDLRVETFLDLIVLAFRAEKTSVASLMLDSEFSTDNTKNTRRYDTVASFQGFEGITRQSMTEEHHSISHNGDGDSIKRRIAINRHQVGFLAKLITKLKAATEPSGTLFDNSMIVYGSGIRDSNEHDHKDLPILLAGKGGGMNPGRHINLAGRPLADLYLTLMQKGGMQVTKFANSGGTITGL